MKPALVLLSAVVLGGCYGSSQRPSPPPDQGACPQPLVGAEATWRHRFGSAIVSSLMGAPHHSASDPLINPGEPAEIHGKFAYGPASKDLQDEEVTLWLQLETCGQWREVATGLTDSDGRVTLTVPAERILAPGAYPYQLVVRGDHSRAYGTIYVVAKGTQVVVFDIDGTLTTDDGEIIEQVAYGGEPELRAGGDEVARRYAAAGYLPVYITGRPYLLRAGTLSWLDRHRFPAGPLITTDRFGEAMPSEAGVGAFKTSALGRLIRDIGLDIFVAYGNATTDVCAYARAGIAPASTYIIGKHAGTACAGFAPSTALSDYLDHLRQLVAIPPAIVPGS